MSAKYYTRRLTRRVLTAFVAVGLALTALNVLLAATPDAGELKSADELALLLKARVGAEWSTPDLFPERIVACEQFRRRVMIFRPGVDWNDPEAVEWSWDPGDAMTEEQAKWFNHIDECKPALGDKVILVTSSTSGAAAVRVRDKKLLFLARPGGSVHSIARFPDGNLVTASSTGRFLALYVVPDERWLDDFNGDVGVSECVKKYELKDAHGVVWDAKRQILWALGGEEFVGYEYSGTKDAPELREVFRVKLQGTQVNGHDLYPAPGYDALMTTGAGINVFDPEKRAFTTVAKQPKIKSISLAHDGTTIIQRALESYWADRIHYGDAADAVAGRLDGAHFYKARWFVPNRFSEPAAE